MDVDDPNGRPMEPRDRHQAAEIERARSIDYRRNAADYDNTQDQANHIHSVWRDLRRDFAGDLLDVADVCRELQVSEQTYYRWRNQFGGLKADEAKRLKDLEKENSTLKRLLADAELEKAALKEIASGNF